MPHRRPLPDSVRVPFRVANLSEEQLAERVDANFESIVAQLNTLFEALNKVIDLRKKRVVGTLGRKVHKLTSTGRHEVATLDDIP